MCLHFPHSENNRLYNNKSVFSNAIWKLMGEPHLKQCWENIWYLWKFLPLNAHNYRVQLLPCDESKSPINKKEINQSAHNVMLSSVRNNSHSEKDISCDNIWSTKDALAFNSSSVLPNNLFRENNRVHQIQWHLWMHNTLQNLILEKWQHYTISKSSSQPREISCFCELSSR